MPDVRGDRADEWRVAQHAQVEVRALPCRLRDSSRADRRDRQRGEADRAEDEGRAAPAERPEQQSGREERERAAEVERGDVEADGSATAGRVRALRDETHAGHVHARESESGDHPQRRRGDDVLRPEREPEIRDGRDERADDDDARRPHAIGERQDDEHRGRVAEEVRGDDPPELRTRRVPLGAHKRQRRRGQLRRQEHERESR